MTNVNNPPVVEEPKAAEKPTLVLSIGSGTYPIFLQFSTKSSTSLEERIKQLIRDEVFPLLPDTNGNDSFHAAAEPVKKA